MNNKNMTALMCLYIKAYHYNNYKCRIFSDNYASKILSEKEYDEISKNLINGISFFNKDFKGTDALKWIVNNRLSPSVLARSAFCEKELLNSIKLGCREYIIYGSGYDTYAYRNKTNIKVFELDKTDVINDKIKRLNSEEINKTNFIECDFTNTKWIEKLLDSSYDKNTISFHSLLGLSYYLTKDEFNIMIKNISNIICDGSSIVFDYPTYDKSINSECVELLAKESNNIMKSKYTYSDIEKIMNDNNLYIYKHLNNEDVNNEYFKIFNHMNPDDKIYATEGVNYCLVVKKSML